MYSFVLIVWCGLDEMSKDLGYVSTKRLTVLHEWARCARPFWLESHTQMRSQRVYHQFVEMDLRYDEPGRQLSILRL